MSLLLWNSNDGNTLDEKENSIYQCLIGKLIYFTFTRPDISYVVNLMSQFIYAPTNKLMQTAKRILSYLKKNPDKSLLFAKLNDLRIEGYSDADWVGSIDTQKSTTGYCIFLGRNLVIWRSKRQTV